MISETMPVIRLEIQHMKHAIIQHMGLLGSELGDRIEEEVEKAVINYPWEQEVSKIFNQALNDQITSYFKWGKGGEIIKKAVCEGFKNLK